MIDAKQAVTCARNAATGLGIRMPEDDENPTAYALYLIMHCVARLRAVEQIIETAANQPEPPRIVS